MGYQLNILFKKLKLCFTLFLFVFSQAFSQDFSAIAKIDTNAILIGQQVKLTLELTQSKNLKINWSEIPDTLSKIEIVQKSKIDTANNSDSTSLIRRQQLIITCFDSGYYVIPPFKFINTANTDTNSNFTETQPVLLIVNTIPVDTTIAIKDIKAPVTVPWSWQDIIPWLIGLLLIVGIVFLFYIIYKKYKKKPVLVEVKKPLRPAHEIALEELNKLEEEKLWQQGNFKFYYTRLSDIVRTYLWHRDNVNAMEMTTEEILKIHSIKQLASEQFIKLKYILESSDLVKFAKVIPIANENEQCLAYAYDFVQATKLTEMKPEEKKEVIS